MDPGFSTKLDTAAINEITYQVKWESLKKGPCGDYFEVIDFDPASNCFYDPVDLNEEAILAQNGLNPSEGNPKFHQQFVYAIAMKTLEHFEQSLGRKIIWSPPIFIKEVLEKNEGIAMCRDSGSTHMHSGTPMPTMIAIREVNPIRVF